MRRFLTAIRHLPPAILLVVFATSAQAASPAESYFSGVTLTDHTGATVDLYALIKDRTVVMNSFFASCSGSCPVMGGAFGAIQNSFADRVGKDLVLISVSVDPANDTPEKLRDYAKRMKAKNGWYFLTGTKEQVDVALRKIGQYVEEREQHYNLFIIGNDRTGLWKKAFGLADAKELVKIVDGVLNDGR